ncbi:type II secretion system F family protein [Lihuaxuella thermophila]|uniref:Tight adherence protein B n=1 Tax=Lihuaxuella thermophila TaxID=1173111 RepID=A0A1H8I4A7_9BACL|nr:type II secretion system F family protein [Lihuaxuella thermophila]SEN63194.1 tight adherence protein B [Lihuaxuella thermophila]
MIAVLGALSVFFVIWALYYYLLMKNIQKANNERIAKWVNRGVGEVRWSDSLADKIDQTSWAQKIQPQIEQASLNLRPSEYGSILFLAAIVLYFAFSLGLGVPALYSFILALLLTPLGSKLFLKSRKHIYANRLDAQLSEACRLLSSAARAGLSIQQGLELVVREMPPPVKNELGMVVREVQLGRDLESALKELLERVNSRDIQVFVNALIIQRRAGGDLGRVMSEMAITMEERKIIQQTVKAVTAQARYSAYALPLISIFVVFMLSKLIDGFFDLFKSTIGIIIIAVFVIMQVVGIILVRQIANIKV